MRRRVQNGRRKSLCISLCILFINSHSILSHEFLLFLHLCDVMIYVFLKKSRAIIMIYLAGIQTLLPSLLFRRDKEFTSEIKSTPHFTQREIRRERFSRASIPFHARNNRHFSPPTS